MPIIELQERLCFVRLDLDSSEIPELLRRHAANYSGVKLLEDQGRALVASGFEFRKSVAFVRDVCAWGRGHRHITKVFRDNSDEEIAAALREAYRLAMDGDAAAAVERVKELKNLGQSFASKQVRFLIPSNAVILDSVIRTGLGYAETVEGYREFLSDCRAVLAWAKASDKLDEKLRVQLRVCDIEAAIFAKLQGY
jgi:hypothetical protein